MFIKNSQRGFTLIEALIYIALFALIIGGGLIAAYQLIEGTARIENKTIIEAEANFLLRKFDWALGGITKFNILEPSVVQSGWPVLRVLKDGVQVKFELIDGVVWINGADELSSGRVVVSDLFFNHVAAVGGRPPALEILFFIDGRQFGTSTRYIR